MTLPNPDQSSAAVPTPSITVDLSLPMHKAITVLNRALGRYHSTAYEQVLKQWEDDVSQCYSDFETEIRSYGLATKAEFNLVGDPAKRLAAIATTLLSHLQNLPTNDKPDVTPSPEMSARIARIQCKDLRAIIKVAADEFTGGYSRDQVLQIALAFYQVQNLPEQ